MPPPQASRYNSSALRALDGISEVLTGPFTHTLSLATASYVLTTHDDVGSAVLFVRFAVIGPLLFLLSLLLLLPGLIGWLVWIAINSSASDRIQPFIYASNPPSSSSSSSAAIRSSAKTKMDEDGTSRFKEGRMSLTLASANVLLAPEAVARFNNCPNTSWRVKEISRRLLRQDPSLNRKYNLHPPVRREEVVVSQLPGIDILLLQEVVERWVGRRLVDALKVEYPYCVYDVGVHSAHTNFFMCGSGLFMASRYPILDCSFVPFNNFSHFGYLVSLGVLMAKLDLGMEEEEEEERKKKRRIAYVANTHTQAFQGKKNIVSRQLTDLMDAYTKYVHETHNTHTEKLMCVLIGGDFNVDNMSEGDRETQRHRLWHTFRDPCRKAPGEDAPWSIGTEHRQRQLAHPALQHPETFRDVLMDDVLRRYFMLDADVKVNTLELMRVEPQRDAEGKVSSTPWGGRRRIDHLLLQQGGRMVEASFWFASTLASLTDHIPVVMTVEEEGEEEEEKEGEEEGKKNV